MKKFILVILSCLFCFANNYCQDGKLDSTFGYGIVQTKFGESQLDNSSVNKVLLLPDGNMYVLYRHPNLLAKRHADGTLDVTFGWGGFSSVNIDIADAALQTDGKVIITGSKSYNVDDDYSPGVALIRYNTDGTLDNAFSGNWNSNYQRPGGYQEEHPTSVIIQKDGKILVASSFTYNQASFVLYRFNADGTGDFKVSDPEFNEGHSLAIQSDGKIVVAAEVTNGDQKNFSIARYKANGTRDSSFSKDGKQPIDFTPGYNGVAMQSDGKIVVGGVVNTNSQSSLILARYTGNGTPDATFHGDGEVAIKFGEGCSGASVAIQNDGRIVVAGQALTAGDGDFFITRFNNNGSLDNSFSGDGQQVTDFGSVNDGVAVADIQIDGKIVAGGSGANLARYNTDGNLDNAFSKDGKQEMELTPHNDNAVSAVVQHDGKVVVIGYAIKNDTSISFLSRFNTDGNIDTAFGIEGQQQIGFGQSIAIQKDGKFLVAGTINTRNGSDFALARYNNNGTLDITFSKDGKLTTDFEAGNEQATVVDVQSDGKIVVGGSATRADHGDTVFISLARYNTDGTLDATFSEDGKLITQLQYITAKFLAIQSDRKIVVCSTDGPGLFVVARYDTNGTLDTTFSEDGIQTTNFDEGTGHFFVDLDASPQSVEVQSDGKIVVGGAAENFPSFAIADPIPVVIVLARYNTDGSLDTTFSNDGKQNFTIASSPESLSALAIQNDGKIVVAGKTGYGNYSDQDFVFARLNTDGNLDTTFDEDGKQVTDISGENDGINDAIIFENKLYVIGQAGYIGGVLVRYLLDEKPQTPPTVGITTPTNNTTYLAPAAHIKLSAAAADKDGTITKVEFYNGTALLHIETLAPYGFVWRNVALGNYTLTAKAYDNSGLVTTSTPVHISVVPNKPPTVNIVTPRNNQAFATPGYIHFAADATDIDGRITRVEFYNGSTLLRTEFKTPYTYVWKNVPRGRYSITAVATDNRGARTTSAPVTVKVVLPPATIVSSKPLPGKPTLDVEGSASLRLNPNPARNTVNVIIEGFQPFKQAQLSVLSASGIIFKTMQINATYKTLQLDVSLLAQGVYTIKVVSGNKVTYKQFVKL